MFWSVKSTVLPAKDYNFKPIMRAQTRNLCYALQILAIKEMGLGGGAWVNALIKGTFMKNLVSDSVEWSSKNLWKRTSADVKTDVKQ